MVKKGHFEEINFKFQNPGRFQPCRDQWRAFWQRQKLIQGPATCMSLAR